MAGCGDVLSLEDLQTAKKHQIFEAEVITGKVGGVASGVGIDYATNQVTGQTQKTMPAVLRDAGFDQASFTFTTGGTLGVNDRDKAVFDPVSKAWYTWAGTLPKVVPAGTNPVGDSDWRPWTDPTLRDDLAAPGGAQNVKNSVRWFDSIQAMLAATDLDIGQKVSTGNSVWKISSSSKGWPLDNGTQYAHPLNGVYVEDAGADPLGVADSYPAFEFVRSKFDADNKRRFSMCLGGGDYKVSQELALRGVNSYFRINGNGATITATANMDAVISWPMITSIRIGGIRFAHSAGVTIASGIIYGGKEASASKTTRNIIQDVEAYNITGAAAFILMKQTWESKFRDIRSNHDVSGLTGTNIKLMSCVNNEFSGIEVGYSAIGIHFSKSPDVTYKCEGINFTGITTYAKVAVKGDFITGLRIKGVFDFCETRAMEFTNGADVEVNAWMANTTTSTAGGSLLISQPSFSGVKISGSHFVNNSAGTFNAASLNSPNSKIIGNTGQNCQPGFRLKGTEDWGNNFGVSLTQANVISGVSATLWGDATSAPTFRVRSGKNAASSGQLLSRIELTAPGVNANNVATIDAIQGNTGDQVMLKLGWNGALKFNLNLVSGDVEVLSLGRGLRMVSPDGLTTRTLRLNNSGATELIP